MDHFFQPGRVLHADPNNDIRIPFQGQIPPPGYTLFEDSIVHVRYDPFSNRYYPVSSSFGHF
jgi:hypothetical protein